MNDEPLPQEFQAWADEAQACVDSGEVIVSDHRKAHATIVALRSHADLSAQLASAHAEVVHTQDELGALLHAAEAERDSLRIQVETLTIALEAPTKEEMAARLQLASARKALEALEELTAVQKAYGMLWQEISDRPRVHEARKILLATMTKDEQRDAIAWVKQHAPITEREILENSP